MKLTTMMITYRKSTFDRLHLSIMNIYRLLLFLSFLCSCLGGCSPGYYLGSYHNVNDCLICPRGYKCSGDGLKFSLYGGYWSEQSEDLSFFSRNALYEGLSRDFIDIEGATNGRICKQTSSCYASGFTNGQFMVVFRGYINPSEVFTQLYSDTWTFTLSSDDASYLWIDYPDSTNVVNLDKNKALIRNGGTHATQTKSGTYILGTVRNYPITIIYGNGYNEYSLKLTVKVGFDYNNYGNIEEDIKEIDYVFRPTPEPNPAPCPPGTYQPNQGQTSCILCPVLSYTDKTGQTACSLCPAGTYNFEIGQSSCIPCPAGFFNPTPGKYCQQCPFPKYSQSGQSSCSYCPNIQKPVNSDIYGGYVATDCQWCDGSSIKDNPKRPAKGHWIGGGSMQCQCLEGWSGPLCDQNSCQAQLPSLSLIAILFNLDTTLQSYSNNYASISKSDDQLLSVTRYLSDLLIVQCDMNGDGLIQRSEILSVLKYNSLDTSTLSTYPVWCRLYEPTTPCDDENVLVSSVYEYALLNFHTYSVKHRFDGSGSSLISNLVSVFPVPAWTKQQCTASNYLLRPGISVTTTFKFDSTNDEYALCGYVNGAVTDKDLIQTKKFIETPAITSGSVKKLYCIASSSTVDFAYECTVGLYYDGSAVDLRAILSFQGVVFSYLDTSISEKEFDIFRGIKDSAPEDKSFVVGIPYPASGCGRISSHVSFSDKVVMKNVGQVYEYGIRSVQTKDATIANPEYIDSSMATFAYRIPFLSSVQGSVVTKSGVGVEGVTVDFCHIDPLTGRNDVIAANCPLVSFVTDARGEFSGEVRVSNVTWINTAELFNVTARYNETLADKSIVEHVFTPSSQILRMNQLENSIIIITDNTTVSIFGRVLFDTINTDGYHCPFQNVPVRLVHGNGRIEESVSNSSGFFEFSITKGDQVNVYLPGYQGHAFDSMIITPMNSLSSSDLKQDTPLPTVDPTLAPTAVPIYSTMMPTDLPTLEPSSVPTVEPTLKPSLVNNTYTPSASHTPTKRTTSAPTFKFICPKGYLQRGSVADNPSPLDTNKVTFKKTFGQIAITKPATPEIAYCESADGWHIVCPYGWQLESLGPNQILNCIPSTFRPTAAPTSQPTGQPSEIPTYTPSAPTATPTIIPSLSPTTLRPSAAPTTLQPTAPTMHPTILINDIFSPQLLHQYSFNDVYPSGVVPSGGELLDSTMNSNATLFNGITLKNGKAEFSGRPKQYIQLPYQSVMSARIITVEAWVTFHADNDPAAALFSLEPGFVYQSGYTGKTVDVYIAVIFDTYAQQFREYTDGVLTRSQDFFGQRITFDPDSFIGSKLDIHLLSADLDEFRIWSGALSSQTIYSHYITGVDPSHIILSSKSTISDITLIFKSTSKQPINIAMYGGISQVPMFGEETTFTVSAADPQCAYSTTLSLDRLRSSRSLTLAAMNYTVTLTSSTSSVPQFVTTGMYCDKDSLKPFDYLNKLGKLSQNITITNVNNTEYGIIYTYHSGICFQAIGSEQFSLTEGPCFSPDATILERGEISHLNILVTELYPLTYPYNAWTMPSPNNIKKLLDTDQQSIDFKVSSVSITINDFVSGFSSPQVFNYNSTLRGFAYNIKAGSPLTVSPFSWPFQVYVTRDDTPSGDENTTPLTSSASQVWFIPVTGVLNNEVPNFYPVAANPNMIFLVLRDPPGGGSYTTFHAGKTINFKLGSDQLQAFGASSKAETDNTLGASGRASAGLGVEVQNSEVDESGDAIRTNSQSVTSSLASSSEYTFSLSFNYDISTSNAPNVAGHLSDVIVGGGVDIQVAEAIRVFSLVDAKTQQVCLQAANTFTWLPGKVTTFVMPVIEIEQTIAKLSGIVNDMNKADNSQELLDQLYGGKNQSTYVKQLNHQITNWKIVLANYRSHNDDTQSALTAEQAILDSLLETYNQWQVSEQVGIYYLIFLADNLRYVSDIIALTGVRGNIAKSLGKLAKRAILTANKVDRFKKFGANVKARNSKLPDYQYVQNDVKKLQTKLDSNDAEIKKLQELNKKKSIQKNLDKIDDLKKQNSQIKNTLSLRKEKLKEVTPNPVSLQSFTSGSIALGAGANYIFQYGLPTLTNLAISKEVSDRINPENFANFFDDLTSGCNMPTLTDDGDVMDDPMVSLVMSSLCNPLLGDTTTTTTTTMNDDGILNAESNGANIAGGLQKDSIFNSLMKNDLDNDMFGFLTDSTKTITYGAGAPVTLSWKTTTGYSTTYNNKFTYTSDDEIDIHLKFDHEILGVRFNFDYQLPSLVLHKENEKDKHITNDDERERTITVVLDDPDVGDYFVVQISQDQTYYTPVFRTLGGQSKCPGETLTSRRESNVKIVNIIPRCGDDHRSPCDISTLKSSSETASFGVVILNLSPTKDEVFYTLQLTYKYDHFSFKGYQGGNTPEHCGTPGQASGLSVSFSQTDLQYIPYNELIEIPFTVSIGPYCSSYTDIEVQIIASCESPSPSLTSALTIQYGVNADGTISYNEKDKLYASNSTAKFSVHWPTTPTSARKLSNTDESDILSVIQKLHEGQQLQAITIKNMEQHIQLHVTYTRMLILAIVLVLVILFSIIFFIYFYRAANRIEADKNRDMQLYNSQFNI